MSKSVISDPFVILGVAADAGEEEIRVRYLKLVREFPPERDPERFREIRAAYEAVRDPLAIARRLLTPADIDAPPQWSEVLEVQRRRPPGISVAFLLSLGNRAAGESAAAQAPAGADRSETRPAPNE